MTTMALKHVIHVHMTTMALKHVTHEHDNHGAETRDTRTYDDHGAETRDARTHTHTHRTHHVITKTLVEYAYTYSSCDCTHSSLC